MIFVPQRPIRIEQSSDINIQLIILKRIVLMGENLNWVGRVIITWLGCISCEIFRFHPVKETKIQFFVHINDWHKWLTSFQSKLMIKNCLCPLSEFQKWNIPGQLMQSNGKPEFYQLLRFDWLQKVFLIFFNLRWTCIPSRGINNTQY